LRAVPGSAGRFGATAEGDFEAEVAELADVVGDLAADVAAALVVVRAEVLVPHARVRQQLAVDLQLGVADRDLGFELAAAAGQPPVAGTLPGLGPPGGHGGFAEQAGKVPVALLGLGAPGGRVRGFQCLSGLLIDATLVGLVGGGQCSRYLLRSLVPAALCRPSLSCRGP
jgi:hypothetical protein